MAKEYLDPFNANIERVAGKPPKDFKFNKDPSKTTRSETEANPGGIAALMLGGPLAMLFGARPTRQVQRSGGGSANQLDDREQALLNDMQKAIQYNEKAKQACMIEIKKLECVIKHAMERCKMHTQTAEELKQAQMGHMQYYMQH